MTRQNHAIQIRVSSMKKKIFQEFIELYKCGATQEYITQLLLEFEMTFNDFVSILKEHYCTEFGHLKREFKQIIASRDESGVNRCEIAKELNFNQKTIQRACLNEGRPHKIYRNDDTVENLCIKTTYKIVFNENDQLICPISGKPCSLIPSDISNNAYFCSESGEEYHILNNVLYQVDWSKVQ